MSTVLFLALSFPWSQQHLLQPVINYCSLSAVCVHDGRAVCACSPELEGRCRAFLDQCDMYEYNCDYGTHFEKSAYSNSKYTSRPPSTKSLKKRLNEIADSGYLENSPEVKSDPEYNEANKECNISNKCGMPKTWLTTVNGETRDFIRVLDSHRHRFSTSH